MSDRNVMEEFDLLEISAVDRPAQAHAKAVIIKRDDDTYKGKDKKRGGKDKKTMGAGDPMDMSAEEDEEERKRKDKKKGGGHSRDMKKEMGDRSVGVLTSSEMGHSHLVYFYPGSNAGETSHNSGDPDDMGHSHPWAMDADGGIEIGEANGHTHSIDMESLDRALLQMLKYDSGDSTVEAPVTEAAAAANQEDTMSDEAKKSEGLDALQAKIDELTQRAEKAEAINALKADERAHFDSLSGADADAFLGKSEDERVSIMKAAGDADPVVYKSLDGSEFRASDDPRVVKAVQRADEATKAAGDEREKRESLELEKRAEAELPNLPGTPAVRASVLKAVESIEDEDVRKGALEALKSANAGIFERAGGSPEDNGLTKGEGFRAPSGSAEAELETLVSKFQKEHNVPEFKAWDEVLKTAEGAALYRKSTTESAQPAN